MLSLQNIRQNTTTIKNQESNTVWCNPLYSANVVTKVRKRLHSLLDKDFAPQNCFHKIFTRNTVKIGYSCMTNMKTTINSHNHKTITKERIYNYIDTAKCPLSKKLPH